MVRSIFSNELQAAPKPEIQGFEEANRDVIKSSNQDGYSIIITANSNSILSDLKDKIGQKSFSDLTQEEKEEIFKVMAISFNIIKQ